MDRGVFRACLLILCLFPAFVTAQEKDESADELVREGFVEAVAGRYHGDETEWASTTFFVCSNKIPLFFAEAVCDVVWIQGKSEILPGDRALVTGEHQWLTREQYASLQDIVLRGEPTAEQIEQFRRYLDIINAHQRLQGMQGLLYPDLASRFDVLPYIRARQVSKVPDKPEQ